MDSNGKNYAPNVRALLTKLGFPEGECSWSVVKKGSGFSITWTYANIADVYALDSTSKVRYIKMDFDSSGNPVGEAQSGMIGLSNKTVEGKTYVILNGSDTAADTNYGESWS